MTDLSSALTADDANCIAQLAELLATRDADFIEVCAGGTSVLVARHPGITPPQNAVQAAPARIVASPAVGVFHQAQAAHSTGVVAQGDVLGHVHRLDDAVAVVAPEAGRITDSCVPTGTFVEYGQALLRMRAA